MNLLELESRTEHNESKLAKLIAQLKLTLTSVNIFNNAMNLHFCNNSGRIICLILVQSTSSPCDRVSEKVESNLDLSSASARLSTAIK